MANAVLQFTWRDLQRQEIRLEIGQRKSEKLINYMNTMEETFFIMVFLAGGLWEAEAISVTGELHQDVKITCSHTYAESNVKYFCRGVCGYEDVLITSRETDKGSPRKYSIKDEGNTFFVTIYDLRETDSGLYWCGIERTGVDTYNSVDLTVIKGDGFDLRQSNSEMLVYIGAGLGVVVLALATVLLIFFKYRNRDISASSEKDRNTVYATPCHQGARHIATSSLPANEDEDTDGRAISVLSSTAAQHQDISRNHRDGAVSSVTEPVNLFYSTVTFTKQTESSTATLPHAEVTYSTIADMSKDDSAVYCNV